MGGQRHATEIGLKSTGQVHHATRHGGPGGGGAEVSLYSFFNHGARFLLGGQRHVPQTDLYLLDLLFASVCVGFGTAGWGIYLDSAQMKEAVGMMGNFHVTRVKLNEE